MHADTDVKALKAICDKAPAGHRCTLGTPHNGKCSVVREGASWNEQLQGFMCGCGGGFNTAEERDRHAARWSCWQPIATADRYAQPSLDLYDPTHKSEYGVSWDGYWNDADGTDHPETGGHWVAAVWCNSCSDWHATRINPTHWRARPSAPEANLRDMSEQET